MSRHHQSNTNAVAHMIHDVKNMSRLDLLKTYNVEVWEDGQVYDLTINHVYANVNEWANATVEEDIDSDYEQYFDGDDTNAQDWR